jgi:hypothetical protein
MKRIPSGFGEKESLCLPNNPPLKPSEDFLGASEEGGFVDESLPLVSMFFFFLLLLFVVVLGKLVLKENE